jgi:hypothetical protein
MKIKEGLDCLVNLFQQQLEMMVLIKQGFVIFLLIQDPREDEGKGKPITKPRNFQSGPCRSGQLRKSYFGNLNSLASSNIKD